MRWKWPVLIGILVLWTGCAARQPAPAPENLLLAREYIGRIDIQGLVLAELAAEAVRRGVPAWQAPLVVEEISKAMNYDAIQDELAWLAAERFTVQDLQDLLNRSGAVDLPPLSNKIAEFAGEMAEILRLAVDQAVLGRYGLTI